MKIAETLPFEASPLKFYILSILIRFVFPLVITISTFVINLILFIILPFQRT